MTDGHLLGGRLRYAQPAVGFRSGIEPVLLAASIPARESECVLEAGTGAGAALLCLCARVAGLRAAGVEIDADLARLAQANAAANGFGGIRIIPGAIETAALPETVDHAPFDHAPFDHALANPPYHAAGGTESPIIGRENAKRGSSGLIEAWIMRLSTCLRRQGSLTLIVPAGMVASSLAAMAAADSPCSAIFPLWPKRERPAKLVLLRGIRQGRTPMKLMPGLVLHQPDGSFTDAAQAILREGAGLDIDR
jgi:tRNA1(Val) A37 N6-methylase TrmN6